MTKKATIEVDGKRYPATYIGKGEFSRVYRVGDRVVYYTRGDCGKEVLSMFQHDRIAHLPEIIRHENITRVPGKIWYVFSSPWYRNVTKKDKSAYILMNDIISVYQEFWNDTRRYQYKAYKRVTNDITVMQDFVKHVRAECHNVIPRSIVKALQEIVDVSSNCGSEISFDLHKKNFGVNDYGTLIFRDPVVVWER